MEWIYKYFSLTAVIAGVGFLIKYLVQKKIDSYFNTKLEDHKTELAVMTERAKYDISRKLFDFEAYATKKHTIYPELYQRMFEIRRQYAVLTIKMGISNRTDSKEETSLKLMEVIKGVDDAIKNAGEYFNNNELFLSKNVISTYWETWYLLMNLQKDFYNKEYNSSFAHKEISKVQEKIDILKEAIHKELSYSHFEETEEKV
ncbi:hypothetical protein [Peribacillus simplex]|uniref:Uncharacterized protein n=1 Tax=Peribacillus simplex TaxID=1478 RepID=A0AAW7IUJ3_9BACI|nr:hypothetical protein [Peribacillus simplex]MDM5455237.1 hypothetical protein [Peribacillus simplex]